MQNTRAADMRVLGGLYFANSIGAGFGALASTFVIMPRVGLPGTILAAAALNIVAAMIALALSKLEEGESVEGEKTAPPAARHAVPETKRTSALQRILLAAAAITGATSFVYEIGWVRSLNQTLGTSMHSFELMLAAFILGLAFGGGWVRRRAERITDPIRVAAGAQILMGVFALLSLPAFANSFHWMAWFMQGLARTDQGYVFFSLASSAIAIAVMMPAAFFAGMTLPLFTTALLETGHGERSIGRVYAVNTLGAIVGVFAATHFLIPVLGLYSAIFIAAGLDIVLGFVLFAFDKHDETARRSWRVPAFGVASLAAIVFAVAHGHVNPLDQMSGVYRTGGINWSSGDRAIFLKDGKTATIGMVQTEAGERSILTNGKPDAALVRSLSVHPTGDESTMVSLGALPVLLARDPKNIAVIGWGSGLTVHTIAGSTAPRRIEAIEIEPVVHEAARNFGERVERAYRDKRVVTIYEDARSHFARGGMKYDAIVSEPSNPWVSGVSSLFTEQFYTLLDEHLAPGGVLVQWIHAYELDDPLFATMTAALSSRFSHIRVYAAATGDYVLVASQSPIREPDFSRFPAQVVSSELDRLDLGNATALRMRLVADKPMLDAYLAAYDAYPHSDFYPVVALSAPRARFEKAKVTNITFGWDAGLPLIDELVLKGRYDYAGPLVGAGGNPRIRRIALARSLRALLLAPDVGALVDLPSPESFNDALLLRQTAGKALTKEDAHDWQNALTRSMLILGASLSREEMLALFDNGVLRPDLDASPPIVTKVFDAYRTISTRDDAAILALPLAELGSAENGVAGAVPDYVLTAQLLSSLKTRSLQDFSRLIVVSDQYPGQPELRWTRTILKFYGIRMFGLGAVRDALARSQQPAP
jgi:predicted membrane-bound spermidine synthase